MRLEGKKAVVTGAGRGLGNAICERLLSEGCDLVLADIEAEHLQTAVDIFRVEFTKRRVYGVNCDVTEEKDVERLVQTAERKLERIDVFVGNAGIVISGPLVEFDAAQWRKVIEVNLIGQMLCMKHAVSSMLKTGGGAYVQINSKSGKKGSFRNSAYAASKFGALGLLQSVALETAAQGIRVNAVCPGNLLDSPLWQNSLFEQYAKNQGLTKEQVREKYIEKVPMRRGCRYEDVCNLVVFLACDESAYMTGQALNVTGGQEMR